MAGFETAARSARSRPTWSMSTTSAERTSLESIHEGAQWALASHWYPSARRARCVARDWIKGRHGLPPLL